MRLTVPQVLLNSVTEVNGQARAQAWERALDFMLDEVLDRWHLTVDPLPGSPWAGMESLVVPVLTTEGYRAILRFASPNRDNPRVHEQVMRALHTWNGHGAVRVIHEDPSFRVTLQERLRTGVDLSTEPLENVPAIWGQLVRSLLVPGDRSFVRVQDVAAAFPGKLERDTPLLHELPEFRPGPNEDSRVLEIAAAWAHELAISEDSWLLHADLHYYNILAGNPDPHGIATWKAIDPQPVTGPSAYMVAPLLWNRLGEIPATEPEAQAAWLRAFAADLCRHADIDRRYGMGASVMREVENLLWYVRAAAGAARNGDEAGRARFHGDAARSLWVARALSGVSVYGVSAHRLKPLG